MRKVLHLLPESERFSEFHGGAISRWVANVIRGDASGYVVTAGADGSWGHPTTQVMSNRWLSAYRCLLRWTRHRVPWPVRRSLLRLGFKGVIAKMQRGDIVWVHNRPDFAAALAIPVHRSGGRLLLHMHNAHLTTADQRILRQLDVDLVVFVSRHLEQESLPALAYAVPSLVLYNGADGSLFKRKVKHHQPEHRSIKVLFASRLVKEKGAHILLDALRQLRQEGVPLEGTVVGGADFGRTKPDSYMRELVRNAPPNVSFHPYCAGEELVRLFHDADVFCLPSVWHDPFPLAPLEAMAAGLPVVASCSGGIPEALQYGGGILVERGSVNSLVEALRRLACDVELREQLSSEALDAFERHFCWDNVRSNYQEIVRQVAHA